MLLRPPEAGTLRGLGLRLAGTVTAAHIPQQPVILDPTTMSWAPTSQTQRPGQLCGDTQGDPSKHVAKRKRPVRKAPDGAMPTTWHSGKGKTLEAPGSSVVPWGWGRVTPRTQSPALHYVSHPI